MTEPTETATPRPKRPIAWLIALLALVSLGVSITMLAKKVRAYNAEHATELFAYVQVNNTEFVFGGHPVTLGETEDQSGSPVLVVTYGDDTLEIPVAVITRQPFPGFFDRHADWMRIMFFADRAGLSFEEFQQKSQNEEIDLRLAIVTRTPFGADAKKDGVFGLEQEENASTADVRRDRWLFDFYEFDRNGGFIVHQPLRFPESGKSLLRRQNNAKLRGEPIPEREPGEIVERSWQYGAALKVMPRAPAITFENQALRAAGWTLPVASSSVLVLVFSVFFAIAPARVKASA